MKLLTPEEVLQAIKDRKPVEINKVGNTKWEILKTHQHNIACLLNEANQFRLAQEMITIGDVSFPKPESKPLSKNIKYYLPYLLNPNSPHEAVWDNVEMDYKYLKLDLIHLSKENAIAHSKALIKLSGGGYE